jgi:murein L,D-transpeptidase YcbB/YkuD
MSPDVGAYLASRSPEWSTVRALQAELAKLKGEGDAEQPINIALAGVLHPGETSSEIPNIVKAIEQAWLGCAEEPRMPRRLLLYRRQRLFAGDRLVRRELPEGTRPEA